MGLFGFLNKEVECENCRTIFDKKQTGKFDTTRQGQNKRWTSQEPL